MEIFKKTGVKESGIIPVTKGVSTLILALEKEYKDLTTETIRVEIERANGTNFEITKGLMSLKDFLLATTYGEDALVSDLPRGFGLVATCEIALNGAIHLFEKDVIKVELKGLDETKKYQINGIEEPLTTTQIFSFEHKSMGSEDTNKDFNVEGYDILVLDKDDSIEEINYSFDNGKIVKYSLFELEVLSKSIDPVAYVKSNNSIQSSFPDKIQLPLIAVVNVNIRKTQGKTINLILRNHI
ncbi:hypothetical protein [Flavobacterium crassostreae]|uniref:Uncharacterized protein n=1 Tax=Flavobacterium crassostreae TaxID=1763534 RepID=A0A1B9EA57_9FLAO|nr:hypothetical protein [Flavobacterium crassostreae]OCB78822.1 hypothetical protein LPBF_00085 [Flavobacterium crassostreae]